LKDSPDKKDPKKWGEDDVVKGGASLMGANTTNPNDEINIFYVQNYTEARAQGWSAEDVGANVANVGAVTNPAGAGGSNRRNDTIAHEIGHILLDRWRWNKSETDKNGIHSQTSLDLMCDGGS